MSTPRSLSFSDDVKAATTQTPRGDFATFTCLPRDSALPRGNALMLPGFTGSKEDFAEVLPLLAAAGWGAAAYDQRGQFETPAGSEDFSLETMAADAVAVSAALFGTEERVHLVGHSFGGLVAAVAAIDHSRTWASLTLLCSGPGGLAGAQREEALEGADTIAREGLETSYRLKAERDAERGAPAPGPEIEEFLRRRFLANSREGLAAVARHVAQAPDRAADLTRLDLPVAVVRGAADDAWPHDVQDGLADELGTRVVIIPEAAHSPAVEQPEATRDALARIWLR